MFHHSASSLPGSGHSLCRVNEAVRRHAGLAPTGHGAMPACQLRLIQESACCFHLLLLLYILTSVSGHFLLSILTLASGFVPCYRY